MLKSSSPPQNQPAHPLIQRHELIGLGFLATALKMPAASPRRLCDTVRALIADHGFPLPGPRMMRGRLIIAGPELVTATSCWMRAEVEDWLNSHCGPTPPTGRAGLTHRAAQIDQAFQLRLIQGGLQAGLQGSARA